MIEIVKPMDIEKRSFEIIGSILEERGIALDELIREGKLAPKLIIGVPVGFVNVVESKELIIASSVPHIVARGRKGGSNVAAAIVNALMYSITR